MNHVNYETHKDEIEILKNILFDDLTIAEEHPLFKLELNLKADISDPKILLKVFIELIEDYPNQPPTYSIIDDSNYLPSKNIREISGKISEMIKENSGFPVIYQMYEMLKEFVNNEENSLKAENEMREKKIEEEKEKEKKRHEMEMSLLETKSFTPVNKETYEKWFKAYIDEINKKNKNKKKADEIAARTSGREFFMNMKNPKDIEAEEKLEEEIENSSNNTGTGKDDDVLFYDQQAFDEDIDNIDFDKIGVDDD
jgi:hypothetical protein